MMYEHDTDCTSKPQKKEVGMFFLHSTAISKDYTEGRQKNSTCFYMHITLSYDLNNLNARVHR